jgi:hypothetical protein
VKNTSAVPDADLRAAIRALGRELPGALDRYLIHVRRSDWDCGRIHYGVTYTDHPDVPWRGRGTIVVRTPGPQHTGTQWVNTLAHEAKHAEQWASGVYRRQRRERQGEPNACAFAAWFRREHLADAI